MGLLASLQELVFPTRCAGCELPGAVLCDTCREAMPLIAAQTACPRCGAPFGRLVCTECWDREWAFEAALSLGEFGSQLARAVVVHKDAGEQRLGAVLGTLLADRVVQTWPGWAKSIAYVPATASAMRRRGFDHGLAIASEVSERMNVRLSRELARADAADQRDLDRDDRARNAAGSFEIVGHVRGNVLLCDDVFTTGATLDAAAALLLEQGASAVRCATVARAW